MILKIESSKNTLYKTIKKLNTKSQREKLGLYLAEGKRNVMDLIKHNALIDTVILSSDYIIDFDHKDLKVCVFSKELFNSLSDTVTSQGIMALIKMENKSVSEMDLKDDKVIVYLDNLQDPGNMGTIIRTCDAFGVDKLVLSKGCVDIYNPKVVRSTMASILNVSIFNDEDTCLTFKLFKDNGFKIVSTSPKGEILSVDANYTDKCVLIIGNEANGVSDLVNSMADMKVKIPMKGNAESLNASCAHAVMLYEIMRDRF